MELQLESFREKSLQHQKQLRGIRSSVGFRGNFVGGLIDPIRSAFDLIRADAIRNPN